MTDIQTFKKRVLNNSFKKKHISKADADNANRVNLILLLIWWDKDSVLLHNGQYVLAENKHSIIYKDMIFNHYTGEATNVLNSLMTFYNLSFPQAYYTANYFRCKVSQAEVESFANASYSRAVKLHPLTSVPNLNRILENDLFSSNDVNIKHHALDRAYAYLCNTRRIDRDWISHFIHQHYLAMDINNNLAFLTYDENGNVISATKKGTNPLHPFKQNNVTEDSTGFWYSSKQVSDYDEIYVFEACVDLMSYLSLSRRGYIDKPSKTACFISSNGVSIKYLLKVLSKYPTINAVHICFDNDEVGSNAAISFKAEYKDKYYVDIPTTQLIKNEVKDWNELLVKYDDKEKLESQEEQPF